MSENQQLSQFQNGTEPNTGTRQVQPEGLVLGSVKSLITNKRSEISEDEIVTPNLMEEVLERENLKAALKRVKSNKGAPSIDGTTVEQLPKFLKQNWESLKVKLLEGKYLPKPVKRVEIPKPDGGFGRELSRTEYGSLVLRLF